MASKLIKELKEQHGQIISLFDSLSSYMAGEIVAKVDVLLSLRKVKALLIKHLKLEDTDLYPMLKHAKNKEAMETGEKFSDEMLKISKVVSAFFDRYLHLQLSDLENNQKFKEELKGITITVTKRVNVEEKVLFPLYEKSRQE